MFQRLCTYFQDVGVLIFGGGGGGVCTTLAKEKNHPCDASCDIEESAVWFRRDSSMREVAAVASRVRSRFRSWIKHLDSSISQDSDFIHQLHGSFFVQGSTFGAYCSRQQISGKNERVLIFGGVLIYGVLQYFVDFLLQLKSFPSWRRRRPSQLNWTLHLHSPNQHHSRRARLTSRRRSVVEDEKKANVWPSRIKCVRLSLIHDILLLGWPHWLQINCEKFEANVDFIPEDLSIQIIFSRALVTPQLTEMFK